MPTISFITEEQHQAELAALRAELRQEFRSLLRAHLPTEEEYVSTEVALRLAELKARSTLVMSARASQPGLKEEGKITYQKRGTKCLYLRSSCIDYAQRRHGQPALAA
jgi:hypothetical protein